MSNYLQNQIAEGEAKLDKLEQEVMRHQHQIDQWREALQVKMNERAVILAKVEAYRDALRHLGEAAPEKMKKRRPQSSARAMSEQWQQVLAYLVSQFPDTVTGTQLYKFCEEQNFGVREDTIRAQMAGFVNKGYVERTEPGQFRASKEQARNASVSKDILDWAYMLYAPASKAEGSVAQTTEPSNNSGPATGRERGYPPSAPEGSIPSGSTASQSPRPFRDLDDEIPF
jgi:regulator of replication initiation timing